jgi:hypothetical protein
MIDRRAVSWVDSTVDSQDLTLVVRSVIWTALLQVALKEKCSASNWEGMSVVPTVAMWGHNWAGSVAGSSVVLMAARWVSLMVAHSVARMDYVKDCLWAENLVAQQVVDLAVRSANYLVVVKVVSWEQRSGVMKDVPLAGCLVEEMEQNLADETASAMDTPSASAMA